MKDIEIIPPAKTKMERRGIAEAWVSEALRKPDQVVEGHGGRSVAHQRRRIRRREMGYFRGDRGQICGDYDVSHFGDKTILEGQSPMKIEYDAAHDLLDIKFLDNVAIDDSLEIDGVVIDYAKDKRIVAIEVLDASKRTTRKPLDLTNLAIVKSTGSGAVRESGEKYGKKRPAKTKRRGSRSK